MAGFFGKSDPVNGTFARSAQAEAPKKRSLSSNARCEIDIPTSDCARLKLPRIQLHAGVRRAVGSREGDSTSEHRCRRQEKSLSWWVLTIRTQDATVKVLTRE